MPASDTSAQRTQALAQRKRRGMTRLTEFSEAAMTATTVARMGRGGELVRLARGLCQLADAALDAQQSLADRSVGLELPTVRRCTWTHKQLAGR